jgi:hypothetical protein
MTFLSLSRPDDTRSPSLQRAHHVLARQAWAGCRQASGTGTAATGSEYYSEVVIGSLLLASLDAAFYDASDHSRLCARFHGLGGGGAIGGGKAWGSTWSSQPLESLLGVSCVAVAILLPFTLTISWHLDESGSIANFIGGGTSIGSGIFVASGRFSEN